LFTPLGTLLIYSKPLFIHSNITFHLVYVTECTVKRFGKIVGKC